MVIQHNLSAMNANRQFGIISQTNASITEKLASGYRINRSADDAAGLSISEKMRKEIRGLNRASLNVEEGISYVQVADGALNEIHDMLQRINELAIQSSNGTNSMSDREAINDEVQQLKSEMERVFETTSFNNERIWRDTSEEYKQAISTKSMQSVSVTTPSFQSNTYTENGITKSYLSNDTYMYYPAQSPYRGSSSLYNYVDDNYAYFTINADENDGLSVTWTAYNGNTYTTKNISWKDVAEQDFSFHISDLLDRVSYTDSSGTHTTNLQNINGYPAFDFSFSFTNITGSTDAHRAQALNGVKIRANQSATMTCKNLATNDSHLISNTSDSDYNDVTIAYCTISTAALYAARTQALAAGDTGYDYTQGITTKIEPSSTSGNFTDSLNSSDWGFNFHMSGLDNLSAKCTTIGYTCNSADRRYPSTSTIAPYHDDDENYWWYSSYWSTDNKYHYYDLVYRINNGTVTGLEDALLGDKSSGGNIGLLTESNGGATNDGGSLYFSFALDVDQNQNGFSDSGDSYSYNNTISPIVGEIVIKINVDKNDTVNTVKDKLNKAFTSSLALELSVNPVQSSFSAQTNQYGYTHENQSLVDVHDFLTGNRYEDIELNIHSGAEDTDKIPIKYECLRLSTLGMEETNVLTQEAALSAIDEVSEALTIVSAQRSLFGAYQNRMEHAYKIDTNTSENTQAAESQIRDTDMAKEMVAFSNTNILEQAGQSMLAQSNQANQGILSLLR